MPNATISLFDRASGNLRKTQSSGSGEYSFSDITPGVYLMEAQVAGESLNASKDITVSGATTEDLMLSVARPVVRVLVTATGTPLSSQEVAKVVDVIDSEQISARAEYSIGEVLRGMPGIQIQTQVGGITQIRTRGLPNQYTAVLIDGLRFRDAAATQGDASVFISDMNVTDQSRVEFMKGSGSDLYGTNAVAGTINLNSNEGGGKFHGGLRAEGGGLGMARGGLNVAGGIKQDRFVYSGGATHINVTSGVRGKTPNRNSSGEFFGKYYFTPKVSLSGRVWGSDSWQRSVDSPAFPSTILPNIPTTGIIQGIALPDSQMALYEKKMPFTAGNATFVPGVPDTDGNRTSTFAATAFIFRYEATANTAFRASYQRVNTRRAMYDGPAGAGSFEPLSSQVSNNNGNTDQLQLRFDNRSGGFNQFTGGYEFEGELIDSIGARNLNSLTKVSTTAKQESHSIYGQDQIRLLSNRLQIVFGGRIQFFSMKTPSFTGATSPYQKVTVASPENAYTGDVSISYFFPSSTKLRGHVGNGYRAPSLYERFGSGGGTNGNFTYYGDPRLPSEKSFSFDGGIDQYFFGNKARASATFFYTDLSQTIIFGALPQPDVFGRNSGYYNSAGGGIARGVELSGQFSPTTRTSITLSYTHNNAETRLPNSGIYDALRTARHIGSVTATQWFTQRFSVTVDFYGLSDILDPAFIGSGTRVIQYPSIKKTDVVANYRFALKNEQTLDVYTKWDNVFDVRYTDSGFLAPQAWGIAGVKWNF